MEKILEKLDFWRGKKSVIGAIALLASTTYLLITGEQIDQAKFSDFIVEILNNTYVMAEAGFVIYGLIFKIIRRIFNY